MVCVYCCESFENPSHFREHMTKNHPNVKISLAFAHLSDGYIKVDCTDLRCRICLVNLNNLAGAVEHLVKKHNRQIDLTCDMGVQLFILPDEKWECSMCDNKFITMRALSRHTQGHFAKHNCECGKSYFYLNSLRQHKMVAHIGQQRICLKCKMTFETLDDKKEHIKESPLCWEFTCAVCGERFPTLTLRNSHRKQIHGVQSKSYVCSECPKIFANRRAYKSHFIVTHTNEYVACTCGRKLESEAALKRHMVVHAKDKEFPCTVCSKVFYRRSNLKQHMCIHSKQTNNE